MGIIYEPNGRAREYAQLAANLYEGCDHGCTYCFGPSILRKKRNIFHSVNQPKKEALIEFEKDAKKLGNAGDDREILLSFVTDPYQTIESELNITKQAIEILIENNLRFTILTKGGPRAARDFNLLKNYDKASFGSTICFTEQDDADKWEPNAPAIDMRIEAIKAAHEMGIRTWVSLEPVIDPDQALELIEQIHPFVDDWKVGKLNYKSLEVDWLKFREDATKLLASVSADYYLKKSLTDLKESKDRNPPKLVPVAANVNSKVAEETDPWTEKDIPIRNGNRNILVIAPHGHSKNDKGTYEFARRLADELDCYAVVNKKYQKPESAKLNVPDASKFAVDLNRWEQFNQFPETKKDFFGPIKRFKKLNLTEHKDLLILHIHGIGDINSRKAAKLLPEYKKNPESLHLLIGYGQRKNDSSRQTADINTFVSPLINELKEQGINSAMAPIEPIKNKNGDDQWYCGNDEKRLNQYLCRPKNKVQSLQLELKNRGVRDKKLNIEKTAIKLADAVRAVWKKDIQEEKQKLAVIAVPEPDFDKVYSHLMAIVSKGFENTMLRVGRYLIKTFYGGNIKIAQEDKKKQSLNSLNQYILKIREQHPDSPRKSWIYNSVNLVIDHETIKNHSNKLFHTYGKLSLSHKVLLFPIKNLQEKKRLIEYVYAHKLTVEQFRNKLTEASKKQKTKLKEPVINNIDRPKFLFGDKLSEFLQVEYLNKLDLKHLEKIQSRTTEYIRGYRELLQLLKDVIKDK